MLRKLIAGFISANSSIIRKWGQSWWHFLSHRFRIKKRWPKFASSSLYEAIQRRLQWRGCRLCLILGSFARDLAERWQSFNRQVVQFSLRFFCPDFCIYYNLETGRYYHDSVEVRMESMLSFCAE